MKILRSFLTILSLTAFIGLSCMEEGAKIPKVFTFKKEPSKIGQEKTLNVLARELNNLKMLINLNGPTEAKIFAFTDNLIKKGPGGAKLVRKMVQEYARINQIPNPENYTYGQFKDDIMKSILQAWDKKIEEKAKEFEEAYPSDKEKQKLEAARELQAYVWSRNEAKINKMYKELLNEWLATHIEKEKDNFAEDLKLGANSFVTINLPRLQDNKFLPLIIRAAAKSRIEILENILKYDQNYDQDVLNKAVNELKEKQKKEHSHVISQAINLLKRIENKKSKNIKLDESFEKPSEETAQVATPQSTKQTKSGWFPGLSNWWYGSGKEEKK